MVKTRIAPSPTGDPHIGTAYSALFNYAFARKNKGKFVLRIEDTDRTRLVSGSIEKILDFLKWLGLDWDEGPYKQSERLIIYKKAAKKLVEKGAAYYCNCSSSRLGKLRESQQAKKEVPRYDGKCRLKPPKKGPFVVRLKVPEEGETRFKDLIRGEITFKNKDIDDAVILKSDGWPTYHLAVVVDDSDMKITHVIRAEEWLSSTPKHVLLYKAFGLEPALFVHLPLLRNRDKSKISKRKNPISLEWYKKEGYLPEAILNYLSLMGWSMPDGREKFSLEEFIREFDVSRIDPAGPIFDLQKLDWLNGEWIRSLPTKETSKRLGGYTKRTPEEIGKVLPLVYERMKKLSEFDLLTSYFFQDKVELDENILVRKGKTPKEVISVLYNIKDSVLKTKKWDRKTIDQFLEGKPAELGWSKTDLFQTIRYSVSGSIGTPPLDETLEKIGQERTEDRLGETIRLLENTPDKKTK
jgi:glutamyl-tRNA synthetase